MSTAGAKPVGSPVIDFEASYPDLVRYMARQTGDGDLARDLVHDTWLRLTMASASPPLNARAYLFGATRHAAIDHVRRDRHRSELLADARPRQSIHVPDVAEQVGHRQALHAVVRALQALPERTRDAFLSHRLEGEGQDELALRHGVTRSTIERDIRRAQDQVEDAMGRWLGGQPSQGRRRRGALGALLGMGGVALLTPALWRLWQSTVPQWQQAFVTPSRRMTRYTLPDGTVLTLDADSAIEAAYFGDHRELSLLRGTAFFDVAHDASRPFEVQVGPARGVVVGTRFELALAGDPAKPQAHVVVEQGRVRVQPRQGAAFVLGAGESIQVRADGEAVHESSQEGRSIASWREGWLSFSSAPLADVAQRLARYRTKPLHVAPDIAQLPVSGEVRIALAEEWLQLLPRMLPIKIEVGPDGSLSLLPC